MGAADSREIRHFVDEALVALRSEQRRGGGGAMSGPVMDEDGLVVDEGGGGYYYCLDDDDDGNCFSSSSSGDDSDSDSWDSDSAGCCCDGWEDECCFEMVECCGGGGGGGGMGGCVLGAGPQYGRGRSCGGGDRRDGNKKREKEKGKKKKKKTKGKKGGSLWQRCYPVRKRGDWGGDVVGVSRCPGEDPKKWGFKIDHHRPQPHHTPRVVARHVCAPGSCYHDGDDGPLSRPGSRDRVVLTRRRRPRTRGRDHYDTAPILRGGDECTTHPRRGRRRTLLFDEYEAYPRGGRYEYLGGGTSTPTEETPAPVRLVRERSYTPARIVRESGSRRRRWGRRRGGDEDDGRADGMVMMHGALVDDGDRGGGGGGYGRRRRERSWERRSDPDDRIGEIDDRTEHSYVMGERMAAVPRREDAGRRMVRFQRS